MIKRICLFRLSSFLVLALVLFLSGSSFALASDQQKLIDTLEAQRAAIEQLRANTNSNFDRVQRELDSAGKPSGSSSNSTNNQSSLPPSPPSFRSADERRAWEARQLEERKARIDAMSELQKKKLGEVQKQLRELQGVSNGNSVDKSKAPTPELCAMKFMLVAKNAKSIEELQPYFSTAGWQQAHGDTAASKLKFYKDIGKKVVGTKSVKVNGRDAIVIARTADGGTMAISLFNEGDYWRMHNLPGMKK